MSLRASSLMLGSTIISWSPMATTIVRRGSRAPTTFLIDTPVMFCRYRATASAANTTVKCASMESLVRWKTGLALRSDLAIRNDCSTFHRSWYDATAAWPSMIVESILVTYPLYPAAWRARSIEASSKVTFCPMSLTNRCFFKGSARWATR